MVSVNPPSKFDAKPSSILAPEAHARRHRIGADDMPKDTRHPCLGGWRAGRPEHRSRTNKQRASGEQGSKDRRTGPRTATARARRDVDDQHDAPPRPGKAPRTTATTQHDAPPRESPATRRAEHQSMSPISPAPRRRRRLNTHRDDGAGDDSTQRSAPNDVKV